jgi:hypothetical protein
VPILLNVKELRPMVHPELTKKKPRESKYQSLTKFEEGIIEDIEGSTKTIRSCVRDERLNKPGSL